MCNFGMVTLGQSYDTIMNQTPQWVFKQLQLEQDKLKEDKPDGVTRKEFLTMLSQMTNFDRVKHLELANGRR